ncbi:MAG: heavy-metal-associated domain-containing protein [Anaerolineales bacterium]|nr:heavy-metal-associated domain-containing protein [Anaerolineales bacterium]
MISKTYAVPNISCGHCVHTITSELTLLEGVLGVEASQERKDVKIEFDAPATEEAIRALMAEINYPIAG